MGLNDEPGPREALCDHIVLAVDARAVVVRTPQHDADRTGAMLDNHACDIAQVIIADMATIVISVIAIQVILDVLLHVILHVNIKGGIDVEAGTRQVELASLQHCRELVLDKVDEVGRKILGGGLWAEEVGRRRLRQRRLHIARCDVPRCYHRLQYLRLAVVRKLWVLPADCWCLGSAECPPASTPATDRDVAPPIHRSWGRPDSRSRRLPQRRCRMPPGHRESN